MIGRVPFLQGTDFPENRDPLNIDNQMMAFNSSAQLELRDGFGGRKATFNSSVSLELRNGIEVN